MIRTGYQIKWRVKWWRVPGWFFKWHYMRHHRKAFGLTRREHRVLREEEEKTGT